MELNEPTFEDGPAMRVAGLSGDFTRETMDGILLLWERFNQELAQSGIVTEWTLGVIYPTAVMRYICCVELTPEMALPEGWVEATVPAQRYVVFSETGGVAAIRKVFPAIFMEWLPKSGVKNTDGPMLERYPENWLSSGDFEILIPVESGAGA